MSVEDLLRAQGRECACLNLRMAARAITQIYDQALSSSGLRATQFSLLGATLALGPVTVSRLAEATVTDRTTLTRNLKLLEKERLIRVAVGKDRREREVTLTERGRKALERAYPLWRSVQSRVVEELGKGEWRALREGLGSLVSLAREG